MKLYVLIKKSPKFSRVMELTVEATDPVISVKGKIERKSVQNPIQLQRLMFNDGELQNHRPLLYYFIQDGSTIVLERLTEEPNKYTLGKLFSKASSALPIIEMQFNVVNSTDEFCHRFHMSKNSRHRLDLRLDAGDRVSEVFAVTLNNHECDTNPDGPCSEKWRFLPIQAMTFSRFKRSNYAEKPRQVPVPELSAGDEIIFGDVGINVKFGGIYNDGPRDLVRVEEKEICSRPEQWRADLNVGSSVDVFDQDSSKWFKASVIGFPRKHLLVASPHKNSSLIYVHRNSIYVAPFRTHTNHNEESGHMKISWEWQHDSRLFQPFEDQISDQLERMSVGTSTRIAIGDWSYTMTRQSLNRGLQQNVATKKNREIRRRTSIIDEDEEKATSPRTNYFVTPRTHSSFLRVLDVETFEGTPPFWELDVPRNFRSALTPDLPLFGFISSEFHRTAPKSRFTIVRIETIQNRRLLRMYQGQRLGMSEFVSEFNDKFLWHGTKSVSVDAIVRSGFNRNFANATRLGNGIYFARDAVYSCHDKYSPRDSSGLKNLLFCVVCCGKSVQGKYSSGNDHGLPDDDSSYDTIVDNLGNPSVFVAPRDHMAYPVALVQFRGL